MPEPDAALSHDVGLIASCRAIPAGLAIAGWRYDVETGRIVELIATSTTGW
jgi:carbonic anhydrase